MDAPGRAGVIWESELASVENSLPPQLIDTSHLPNLFAPATVVVATSTAAKRSAKELLAASTRTIFALGAMACAHSISRAASCPQPQLDRGLLPLAYTVLKQPFAVVHEGRPNCVEKTLRSFSAVG